LPFSGPSDDISLRSNGAALLSLELALFGDAIFTEPLLFALFEEYLDAKGFSLSCPCQDTVRIHLVAVGEICVHVLEAEMLASPYD
jgi:hypothetical protein